MTSVIDTMPSARAAPVGPVSEMLTRAYGRTELYNLRNPLSELLFIICSALTQEANYRATYASLRRSFPTIASLAAASEDEIAASIARGGLSARKARGIRHILDRLAAEFGRPTLAPLRGWSDAECERFLTSLPLVGRKTARCVMLFSLDRQVFPVDRHCWRISKDQWAVTFAAAKSRLGTVPAQVVAQVESGLAGEWAYRTSWRMQPSPVSHPAWTR